MAVMAAQRFPDDYDGIIAGALANRHIHMHTAGFARQHRAGSQSRHGDPAGKGAVRQRRGDGQVRHAARRFPEQPEQCTFDFSTLAVQSGGRANQCLTPAQLKTVDMFYGGLKNSKGEVIFAGQTLGNPLTPLRSNQDINVTDTVRIWAFQNANYDWHTFDLDRDMPIIDQKIGFVDAIDPDLKTVQGARRQAAAVRRLGRHGHHASQHRRCTTRAS